MATRLYVDRLCEDITSRNKGDWGKKNKEIEYGP